MSNDQAGGDPVPTGSTGSTSYGQQPPPYGQPSPQYGQPQYGQPQYGQPQYGAAGYGQPRYGAAGYGQPRYGAAGYGQPRYGAAGYGQTGPTTPPRPGTVITAAVLGLVHAALGLLTTLGLLAGGAFIDDLVDTVADADPSIDAEAAATGIDSVRVALVLLGVVALAWTVVMVWGSVLALRGRSRVLLLVGSSIAVVAGGLLLFAGLLGAVADPGQEGQAGGVLLLLALFLASLAMLVLLCLRSAAHFFAAHRQRRAFAGR